MNVGAVGHEVFQAGITHQDRDAISGTCVNVSAS